MPMTRWWDRLFPAPDAEPYLLAEVGEELRFDVGHHWIAFVRPALLALLAAVILLVVFPLSSLDVGWFWLLCVLALAGWAWYRAAWERYDRFVLTSKRLMRMSGIPALSETRRASIPLSRILDITVQQPLLGRMLGYGHLVFESAAQVQGLREIKHVRDPDLLDRIIQTEVYRHRAASRQVDY